MFFLSVSFSFSRAVKLRMNTVSLYTGDTKGLSQAQKVSPSDSIQSNTVAGYADIVYLHLDLDLLQLHIGKGNYRIHEPD